MKPMTEHDAASLASAFQGVELVRAVERQIAANFGIRESGGDTLEENVITMLDNCPYTIRDMSGERTGARWKEDLIGSLVLTFLGMQYRLKELEQK